MPRGRNRIADVMVGTSSLCTVIAGVSIISPDVRAGIANAFAGDPSGQLTAMASRASDFVRVLVNVAGDYRADNTPLVGFGILALVLTVMMFRT